MADETCTRPGDTPTDRILDERPARRIVLGEANPHGWRHAYGDLVPAWFAPYLRSEQAAAVIRAYEVQFVPGLLQAPGYARAVIELGHAEEIERRVELRMRRQEILRRAHPPALWVVIDEAALRRPIGGAAVMSAQLRHLIDACELPHVTIQVLPFRAAGHAGGGPITLLRGAEAGMPDIVYLEHLVTALYPDRPADLDFYRDILNRLAVRADPPAATPGTLRAILREL